MTKTSLFAGCALFAALTVVSCAKPDYRGDFAYAVKAVKDNYPYLAVHLRRDHFDWQQQADRALAETDFSRMELAGFKQALTGLFRGLNGHVGLMDDRFYNYCRAGFNQILNTHPEYRAWVDILDNPKARRAYPDLPVTTLAQAGMGGEVNLALDRHGSFLIISVNSFDLEKTAGDGRKILEFLKRNATADATIVIDIRKNGGGSDDYWQKNLVEPLLQHELTVTSTFLFVGGGESLPFIKAKQPGYRPVAEGGVRLLPPTDLPLYRYMARESTSFKPSPDRLPYRRVIVLMSRANFSSSETFVNFCKQTGFARLVGQNSGGDGIGFDPILVQLPSTGLIFRLPIDMALNPDGSINYELGTKPDVALPASTDALQWVLGQDEKP